MSFISSKTTKRPAVSLQDLGGSLQLSSELIIFPTQLCRPVPFANLLEWTSHFSSGCWHLLKQKNVAQHGQKKIEGWLNKWSDSPSDTQKQPQIPPPEILLRAPGKDLGHRPQVETFFTRFERTGELKWNQN